MQWVIKNSHSVAWHRFHEKQTAIHKTLCDSFNTPATMSEIKALISASNSYYQESLKSSSSPNADLLSQIGGYISKLLRIFGVFTDANPLVGASSAMSGGMSGANAEETVFPYAEAFSSFRDRVRALAQSKAGRHLFKWMSNMSIVNANPDG
jgi:cysteinyl-tRNA synthetase